MKCGEFGTVAEVASVAPNRAVERPPAVQRLTPARSVSVTARSGGAGRTGVGEFDRVLGGGLVAGQVLLVSGEPGAGKSTLLLDVANAIAASTGRAALYVSGEEASTRSPCGHHE